MAKFCFGAFVLFVLHWDLCVGSLLQLGLFGPPDNSTIRVRSLKSIPKEKHAVLDFVGLVEQHGYPAEEHQLTTSDGYILKIHRIPGSPSNPKSTNKPVVLVQHGILCSSDIFAISDPQRGLVYLLADLGYDVWVGNVRGNTYGRSHVKLSPDDDPAFWEFSFHEMATIDLKDTIDYIMNETGQNSLIFIGHSIGTTLGYALLATKPVYNEIIRLFVAVAPTARFTHRLPRWLQFITDNRQFIMNFLERLEIYEVLPLSSMNLVTADICRNDSPMQQMCLDAYFALSGGGMDQLNTTLLPIFLQHIPAGTSLRLFRHVIQCVLTFGFHEFDYGKEKNYLMYNQSTPPNYDTKKIVAPVALYYSSGDATSLEENLPSLLGDLPNVVAIEKVSHKSFGHMDFLYGRDVKHLVYEKIFKLMEMYKK